MKLTKTLSIYALSGLLVFFSLVMYNYFDAQRNLSSRSSVFGINMVDPPTVVKVGQPVNFTWQVSTDGNFTTPSTAIYYSFNSSPSALLTTDSPSALGYPYHTSDYLTGSYKLPDSFDLTLTFTEPGNVYYRAMSLIEKNYYWTSEHHLLVEE